MIPELVPTNTRFSDRLLPLRRIPLAAVLAFGLGLLILAFVPLSATAAQVQPAAVEATEQNPYEVAALDNRFEPPVITIPVGGTVRWTNRGSSMHSTTSDNGYWHWILVPGARYSVRFLVPGTYGYHCAYHRGQGMTGTVIVTSGTGPTPTASATVTPGPTLPPGRGAIVYDRFPEGGNRTDLFLIRPDGTGKQQLTNTPAFHEAQPDWSPDRQRVAYTSGAGDYRQYPWGLHVLDLASGQARAITAGREHYEPDWRPDGSSIAFTTITRRLDYVVTSSAIAVVAPDGSGFRRLIVLNSTSYALANPGWSPDGQQIVFTVRSDATGGDLYVMNADGSDARRLLGRAGWDDIDPVWSPDGRFIAFASGPNRGRVQDTAHDIWLLDVASGVAGTVVRVPEWDLRRPAWSPDSTHIVFNAEFAQDSWALYIVPATGGAVTGPLDVGFEPDWGSGSLVPWPTAAVSPTPIPTDITPPSPPTFPPFPTPGPSPTQGPPPTFPPPPPTVTVEPTPTPVTATPSPTVTPSPTATLFDGWPLSYLPYVAKIHDFSPGPPTPAPGECLTSELEPNNTLPEADGLPPLCEDRMVRGALPTGDPEDLFRVEVALTGKLEADLLLSGLPEGTNYDLALYREGALDPVAESRQPGLSSEYIYVDVSPGRYYLRVMPAPGSRRSEVPYRLNWVKQ